MNLRGLKVPRLRLRSLPVMQKLQFFVLVVFLIQVLQLLFFSSDSFGLVKLFVYKPKVYLLVPINKPTLSFCRGLRTHLINGYDPILVNFGVDSGGSRANKYFKIRGVYNWILRNSDKLHPKDIITVVDGFDVYSQLPPEKLAQNFIETGKQILVGADKNCFPNDPRGPVCNDIPDSEYSLDAYGPGTDQDRIWGDRTHTRPRWVNSGTIIGYRAPLEKLYASMVEYKAPDDDHGSDQRVFAVHYYWNNFSIAIDFKSQLAVSVAFSEWELDFYNRTDKAKELGIMPIKGVSPTTGDPFMIPRMPLTKNRLMGSIPIFVHFPGVARAAMQRFEDSSWWTAGREDAPRLITDYVKDMEVVIGETEMKFTFSELCSEYIRSWGAIDKPEAEQAREEQLRAQAENEEINR